ncbi:MAG: hypothetical protein ACLFXM_06670 [Acidimicrobiia bacterium]
MALLWTVPVVAALGGALIVVARSRAVEREVTGLGIEVARLRRLRPHLAGMRRSLGALRAELLRLRVRRG